MTDTIIVTHEMMKNFLKTKPDEMFPCINDRALRNRLLSFAKTSGTAWLENKSYSFKYDKNMCSRERYWRAIHQKDKYGRCSNPNYSHGEWIYYTCEACNAKMVYNQTICLKADLSKKDKELKSTKEILEITASELEEVKTSLNNSISLLNEKNMKMSEMTEDKFIYLNMKTNNNYDNIIKEFLHLQYINEIIIFILLCFTFAILNFNNIIANNTILFTIILNTLIFTIIILYLHCHKNIKKFKNIRKYNKRKASAKAARAALEASKYITLKLITF